jgi:hypothetical protein
LQDGAGGAGDIGLATAELLEAAAGAGDTDRDLGLGRFLEFFGNGLSDRINGAGADDLDDLVLSGECGRSGKCCSNECGNAHGLCEFELHYNLHH